MDPRQELYAALVEQLKNIPEVKHVDLWNENVVYADQDEPWQRPAVLIELGAIDWRIQTYAPRSVAETGISNCIR